MRFPFNSYGYYNYIKDPIRQFLIKRKVFKDIDIWKWDMVNAHEVIFAQFKYFCESYPFYFINQYALEYECCKYPSQSIGVPVEEIRESMQEKLDALLRLNEIQEYVLHTRSLNVSKLEFIHTLWHSSFNYSIFDKEFYAEDGIRHPQRSFYMEVEHWFERGELFYTYKKVTDEKVYFNPLDIEEAMDKLDIKYAQEILELKNYIWN